MSQEDNPFAFNVFRITHVPELCMRLLHMYTCEYLHVSRC